MSPDGDNSFQARVLGRRSLGVLHLHDILDAEVVVTSIFVSGRLAMSLFPAASRTGRQIALPRNRRGR
ncbi:DUF5959 family protein [Streptomyces sp. NBC_00353]|uniref:DUF5959 family protein n=1 Tax=Streptomyces sp. NBC_00353 TaxID=2975722 RepID=UPI002E263750